MKIDLSCIPESGIQLEEVIEPKDIDLDTDNIKFREPIKITAEVSDMDDVVGVSIDFETKVNTVCSRCLQECESDLTKHFEFTYHKGQDEKVVDLIEGLRQEMILDFPLNPLCSDDCKGFCCICGANLNEENCNCSK